jgi:hypothetical protein
MLRRMQLLPESERRFSGARVAALGERIRDGLLRDNKVVPAVLAVLALLVFAWLIAGALVGGPPGEEEEQQQASSQASLTPEEDSENQDSGPPAPRVEDRDTESFAAFKAKDPFRQIIPKAKANETTSRSESTTGSRGGSTSGGGGRGAEGGRGGFIEQTSPGGSGDRAGGSRAAGEGNDTSGGGGRTVGEGGNTSGGGPGGGVAGRGGNGDLFNSGGDLPVP